MPKMTTLYTVWMKNNFRQNDYKNGTTYVFDCKEKMERFIKLSIEYASERVCFIIRCCVDVEKIKNTAFGEKRYLIEGKIAFTVCDSMSVYGCGAIFKNDMFDVLDNRVFNALGYHVEFIDNSKKLKTQKNN